MAQARSELGTPAIIQWMMEVPQDEEMTAPWHPSTHRDPGHRGMARLQAMLSEPVMGFLALAALAFAVVPELFEISPGAERLLDAGGWIVIGLFAAEYLLHLLLAKDRRAYVFNPWRLLDLFIILAPLLSFLPGMTSAAKSSPALRILRLVRAIVAGTRAGARLRHHPEAAARPAPVGPPVVSRVVGGAPRAASWDEVLQWARNSAPGWLHAGNLSRERLTQLAAELEISPAFLFAGLSDTSYPKYEKRGDRAFLNLWLPNPSGQRDAVLVILRAGGALTLSMYQTRLPPDAQHGDASDELTPEVILASVVRVILTAHEETAGRIEQAMRLLEEMPADTSPESFFERIFSLRRQLSASKADLRRLRGLLQALSRGRNRLPGAQGPLEHGDDLIEQAAGLYENVDAMNESLLSLLDLHLNIASYGMNRFMRLLAIVSALALIPAVIGGLLGMNLADNPWPLTLDQVAFGVLFAMVTVLYIFLAKGWLK